MCWFRLFHLTCEAPAKEVKRDSQELGWRRGREEQREHETKSVNVVRKLVLKY